MDKKINNTTDAMKHIKKIRDHVDAISNAIDSVDSDIMDEVMDLVAIKSGLVDKTPSSVAVRFLESLSDASPETAAMAVLDDFCSTQGVEFLRQKILLIHEVLYGGLYRDILNPHEDSHVVADSKERIKESSDRADLIFEDTKEVLSENKALHDIIGKLLAVSGGSISYEVFNGVSYSRDDYEFSNSTVHGKVMVDFKLNKRYDS